jgi:cyclic pyranopterin phosphate synthase
VTCLFASGGVDLRAPMRDGASDEQLREIIVAAWQQRTDRYSEERQDLLQVEGARPARRRIEMYQIGG